MYLGLDLGTSGLKALLLDAEGRVLDSAEAGYPTARPHPGWSEQNPADWLAALNAAVAALRARRGAELARLCAIGVSGQMHGAVLLDKAGQVLRPAILWNDSRAECEAAFLDRQAGVRETTANPVFAGFTAPKLRWLANAEPNVFAAVATVFLPKDYLVCSLCGARVSDLSDASGTSWLDMATLEWSEPMLGLSGMTRRQMPKLVHAAEVVGTLRPAVATALGLPKGVAVVAGAADNAAAACGAGVIDDGAGLVSLGTSGVVMLARERRTPDPARAVHLFCHALPGRWIQMGVILSATDSLNWLARLLGQSAEALAGQLKSPPDGPGRLRFLPYLSGERTPHNDSTVRGAFFGLDVGDEARDLTRAVMEGVAFGLRDSLEALRQSGARPTRLLATGGGSRSDFWLQTLANILDLPLDLPRDAAAGAALGAARLAMLGHLGGAAGAIMTAPRIAGCVEPDPRLRGAYDNAYQQFRKIYPAMRDIL